MSEGKTDMLVWPEGVSVARIRWARPTHRLEEVVAFYRDDLGLPLIGEFKDHAGYDGVMLGLPGWETHLEFTRYRFQEPCPAPSRDNLIVLYFDHPADLGRLVNRMRAKGHQPVPPENPYWENRSHTFEDPDGWRVCLALTPGKTV